MQTVFRPRHADEHMTHYEWSGAGSGMTHALPLGTRRDHPWHASTGILALLTTLLILNACDRQGPAERTGAREHAGEKIKQISEALQKP